MHKKMRLNLYIMSMEFSGRNRYYINNDTGIVTTETQEKPVS